jgi:hypothetical protein
MGAPTSPILAEIYMQYLEHNDIYDILVHHHIVAYFRYMLVIHSSFTVTTKQTDLRSIQPTTTLTKIYN